MLFDIYPKFFDVETDMRHFGLVGYIGSGLAAVVDDFGMLQHFLQANFIILCPLALAIIEHFFILYSQSVQGVGERYRVCVQVGAIHHQCDGSACFVTNVHRFIGATG